VVHFGATLLLAALSRAPWPTIIAPAVLWGVVGCGGIVYVAIVLRRMRRQGVYEPEFEDWLFHIALPMAAYAMLVLSALATVSLAREALFGIAAASLLLLFIGIHNAWDAVSYHVFFSRPDPPR
jgi:zinc transporter ZupT